MALSVLPALLVLASGQPVVDGVHGHDVIASVATGRADGNGPGSSASGSGSGSGSGSAPSMSTTAPPVVTPSPTPTCKCCHQVCSLPTTVYNNTGADGLLDVSWQLNTTTHTLNVYLVGHAEDWPRWIGLGFQSNASSSSPMIGATAVVCQPGLDGHGTVGAYTLVNMSAAGMVPLSETLHGVVSVDAANNMTSCNVSLPYSSGDMTTVAGDFDGVSQSVVMAIGNGPVLTASTHSAGSVVGHEGSGAGCNALTVSFNHGAPETTVTTTPVTTTTPTPTCKCCTHPCTVTIPVYNNNGSSGDVNVTWQLDLATSTLTLHVTNTAEDVPRWVGFGFQPNASTSNPMIGAQAMVCQPGATAEEQVGMWNLTQFDPAGMLPLAQNIQGTLMVNASTNVTQCGAVFEYSSGDMLDFINVMSQSVVVAVGNGPLLTSTLHSAGGVAGHEGPGAGCNALNVSFTQGTLPTAPTTTTPGPATSTSSACECCTQQCRQLGTFHDGGSAYALLWQVDLEAETITMTMEVQKRAWLGFALAKSPGSMTNAYAIVCKPESGNISEVTLSQPFQNAQGFVYYKQSSLTSASMVQFEDPTTSQVSTACTWTRPLHASNGAPTLPLTGGNFLLAVGISNDFKAGHVISGPTAAGYPVTPAIDFLSAAAVPASSGAQAALTPFEEWVWVHGVIMTVAWTIVLPIGVMMARFKTLSKPPMWFKLHRGVQCIGWALAIAGFGVIVNAVGDAKRQHFVVTHARLGLAIMVAATLQPLNSIVRPKPAPPGARPPVMRMLWEMTHKALGYGTIIMAWANIFTAFLLPTVLLPNFESSKNILEILFYSSLGFFVATGAILQCCTWRVDSPDRKGGGSYEDDDDRLIDLQLRRL